MTDEYIIGIDLGTTYSCLSYIDNEGEAIVEKNFEQEDTTPSVILFNETGEIIVGSPAKDMSMMYPPERTISTIKRQIGSDYELDIDGEKYNPITLSATILRKIINDFNDNHGCVVKRAVITCPAYFGQNERDATKAAGKVAGLEDVTIINEPTAAAISFGLGEILDGKKRVLVYDLGGGTFDVTILEIDGNSFTAVATDGERLLGGKDWDASITKIIKEKICEESGIDYEEFENDEDIAQALVLDSEIIKKRLSTAESTKGTLTIGGRKIVYTITRPEFESATTPLIQTTMEILNKVMESKAFDIEDIDDIILVGGSSRMPQVKSAIYEKYPNCKLRLFDPDQSVAKGAALFAKSHMWTGGEPEITTEGEIIPYIPAEGEIVVHNVLSKSFGIKANLDEGGEMISNIIFKNEVLPIVSMKTYYPIDDGQNLIKIEIFENNASNNDNERHIELIDGYCVGEFDMELPENITRNTPIVIKFVATDEGILMSYVDCLDMHGEYQLQNKLQMSDADIINSQGLMEKVTNIN